MTSRKAVKPDDKQRSGAVLARIPTDEPTDNEISSRLRSFVNALVSDVDQKVGVPVNALMSEYPSLKRIAFDVLQSSLIHRAAEAGNSTTYFLLAACLLHRGEMGLALQSYRTFLRQSRDEPLVRIAKTAFLKQQLALAINKAATSVQRHEKLKRWYQIGLKYREAERAWPASNDALAKHIALKTGDGISSIHAELANLELDAKHWRARVRKVTRRPSSQKSK